MCSVVFVRVSRVTHVKSCLSRAASYPEKRVSRRRAFSRSPRCLTGDWASLLVRPRFQSTLTRYANCFDWFASVLIPSETTLPVIFLSYLREFDFASRVQPISVHIATSYWREHRFEVRGKLFGLNRACDIFCNIVSVSFGRLVCQVSCYLERTVVIR